MKKIKKIINNFKNLKLQLIFINFTNEELEILETNE